MSEEAKPTPAERAEARRLKILAKKNARMAYASGDRSELPSEAPAEPVREPRYVSLNADNAEVTPFSAGEDVSPPRPDYSRNLFPSTMDFLPANMQSVLPGLAGRPASKQSTFGGGRWLRVLFVACSAMLFSGVTLAEWVVPWKFSAMHAFAAVELCVFTPLLLGRFGSRGISSSGSTSGSLGLLDLLLSASRYASIANQVARDFSVFMLTFLCTWYVCTYV